jgi:hypothetical protein
VAQDPVAAGFRNQQEAIVGADRNAVGKVQPIDDDARLTASTIKSNNAPVSAVFEDVQQACFVSAAPGFRAELGGGIRKIDDAVTRDSEIVRVRQRFAVYCR